MAKQTTKGEKTKSPGYIIAEIIQQSNGRAKKDVKAYMDALKAAENKENPNRIPYHNLCDMLELDNHVSGIIEHSILAKAMADPYSIFNPDGTVNVDITNYFYKEWFRDFAGMFAWHIMRGTRLAQIVWEPAKDDISCELFPDRHYLPETGIIVKKQGDRNGYSIEDPALSRFLVRIGKPGFLGAFSKGAPQILFKRNAKVCWSEYTEIFGMPMRIGRTNSRNTKDLDRMEQNLINMGSAAYGIFQDGESLEIKETSRTDAYKVYDALIERCNSELSKLLVGQTMTSDNGSSRSQGEVHERTLEDVVSWFKIGLMMIVNSQAMPKLIQQGFPAANLRFTFDEVKDIDKLWKIVEGLLGYYDIEEQYIMDTFGIPVKKKEVLKTEPAKKKA